MVLDATWMDTIPHLGQAGRVDEARALASRPGVSFVETSGGRIRVRRGGSTGRISVLLAADGPNVIEHYDHWGLLPLAVSLFSTLVVYRKRGISLPITLCCVNRNTN